MQRLVQELCSLGPVGKQSFAGSWDEKEARSLEAKWALDEQREISSLLM